LSAGRFSRRALLRRDEISMEGTPKFLRGGKLLRGVCFWDLGAILKIPPLRRKQEHFCRGEPKIASLAVVKTVNVIDNVDFGFPTYGQFEKRNFLA